MPLFIGAGRVFILAFLEVVTEGSLHKLEDLKRIIGEFFVEVFIEGIEIVDFNWQDIPSVADLGLQSFVIDTGVFAAKVMKEVLEDVLIVSVASFNWCT